MLLRDTNQYFFITYFWQPDGAGSRCLDCGIESRCPYSAKKLYIDRVKLVMHKDPF